MAAVTKTDKMICPSCRVEMNHHCDKIVYNVDAHDAGKADSSLGGIIEEFHTCQVWRRRHAPRLDYVALRLPRRPQVPPDSF